MMLRCLSIALLIFVLVPFANRADAQTVTIVCPQVNFPGIEVSVNNSDERSWRVIAPTLAAVGASDSFGTLVCEYAHPWGRMKVVTQLPVNHSCQMKSQDPTRNIPPGAVCVPGSSASPTPPATLRLPQGRILVPRR